MQEFLIAAVDIGTEKISASLGVSSNDNEVEILGSSCINVKGVKRGIIIDEDECRKSFEEVLNKLEYETNKRINEVYVGIPCKTVNCVAVSSTVKIVGDFVRARDINKALDRAKQKLNSIIDEEVCDIIINSYILDGKIVDDNVIGLEGKVLELDLMVLKCKRSLLDTYRRLCNNTRYSIKGFNVNIVSLKNVFLTNKHDRSKKAIIEVGSDSTEIAIFKDNIVMDTISIPLGGFNITNDLSICTKIPINISEDIKRGLAKNYITESNSLEKEIKIGQYIVEKELFYNICKARIEEILMYIKNELKKTRHYNDICSIILCGDALTNFEGIKELVSHVIDDRKIRVVTKNDLGLQNISNIMSLAIVKEVHDRLELIYEDSLNSTREFRIETEEMATSDLETKDLEEKSKNENKSIVGKIKSFLGDMF